MPGQDNRSLLDFTTELRAADTHEQAERVLSAEISKFGFLHFVYALIPRNPNGDVDEYVNINTLDPDWMSFYIKERLYENDYAALHCVHSNHPLYWSKMHRQIEQGVITGPLSKIALISREWGVGNGFTVPLKHIGQYRAGISLIAAPDASVTEQDKLFSCHQPHLLALLDVFHALVDHRSLSVEHYKLTQRQIEVLKWLAEGLLTDGVAHRLNISVDTVDKHLKKARQRLGAATTTQAVARAVSLGLLH